MQKKSNMKLFLGLLGYSVMGNILCLVMTVSIAIMVDIDFMQILATVFASVLFHVVVFTSGYKDGIREKKLYERKETENISKYKWVKMGIVVSAIMIIPSVVLLISKLVDFGVDLLFFYRILNGGVYALSLVTSGSSVSDMPLYAPVIFIIFYALIPLTCHFGYVFAIKGNITMDKIIYKQK